MSGSPDPIGDKQRARLLQAILRDGPVLEEDVFAIMKWACDTRINSAALKMFLDGELAITMKDGEMLWSKRG